MNWWNLLQIVVYSPNKEGGGVELKDTPCEVPLTGADGIYSFENLPSHHHKKYLYAAR